MAEERQETGKKKGNEKASYCPRFIILRFGWSLFVHSARNKTNECKEKRRAVNRIQLYGAVRDASFLQPHYFCLLRHVACEFFVK